MKSYFTSESVTKGHPDKVADQISDAILDALLLSDPYSRSAVETTVEEGRCHIMGEVTTKADVDFESVARRTIRDIGYTSPLLGFSDQSEISVSIHAQSPDIAMGVDSLGAGDQGMMFGYATDETEELMPLSLMLSRALSDRLTDLREKGECPWMRPDGKSQITLLYEDGRIKAIDTVVVSVHHREDIELQDLRREVMEKVILPVLPSSLLSSDTKYFINPTGRFVLGGPAADTGLTGRKIIVDTYGGHAHHGGGAFSGKDSTKVDRSASYAARNIASTIVSAHAAKKAEVQLAYAIGVKEPVSIHVDTFGTSSLDEEVIVRWIRDNWDLSPSGIISLFSLRRPIFYQTASSGHFGHKEFPWEKVDEEKKERLQKLF
ncbi:MAG: methionine adenosyltransferase [Candidatus Ornithospirochaeta sp.]